MQQAKQKVENDGGSTAPSAAGSPSVPSAPSRDTPAMRQYERFKREHPGCMLFFRLGDFYEMFDDDAVRAHRILGITLTQRTAGIPMAGVPFHSAEGYLRRLVEHGERVAVCEQIQDPKDAKGVVERAVVRVVTPGTRVDDSLLDAAARNAVAAAVVMGSRAAIAVAELSTGHFDTVACDASEVGDELARLGISELVVADAAQGPTGLLADLARPIRAAVTVRPPWTLAREEADACLRRHFGVHSTAAWGLDDASVCAAGGLLAYLLETQSGLAVDGAAGTSAGVRSLAHLRPPHAVNRAQSVVLDAWTLRALEVERTALSGSADGSLLSVFTGARTPMGRRLLRDWLCFPLRDRGAIEGRLAAVSVLVQDGALREALAGVLGRVQDVARIHGRVAMRRATPRDVVALGRSVAAATSTSELLEGTPPLAAWHRRLQSMAGPLTALGAHLVAACVEDPPAHLREGGLFRDGFDSDLDAARSLQRDAGEWLARYQAQLIAETGIESLKTGYNRVFGYYIELTQSQAARAPATFTRKQTLRNAERYITPELKGFEERVLTAEARALERERQLFEQLLEEVASHAEGLAAYAQCMGELDVISCFAQTAVRQRLVRPNIADEPLLAVRGGRHMVLDQTLGASFVPNDCMLGANTEDGGNRSRHTLALVTGPNMAGKSTFIRQNAIIALLALAGSFVPADDAAVGLCDRIFARIGAGDELHSGRSTFMVEMTETANILHHATRSSLVILDEIGRGTSTLDGLSLAWAITECLADRGVRTLFATHYHELTALADEMPSIGNLQVVVREWKDEVIFLHRIEPGRADRSYGIHVAKLAGVPLAVVERARRILETLAVHTQVAPPSSAARDAQPGLFDSHASRTPSATDTAGAASAGSATHQAVIDEMRALQIESLSPMEAFDLLRRWRQDLERRS
ncbi:MAG: DNA mismatch repair protein MutS [Planctomycetes bacterium]|nr:DNA mismatch repair protein MutS [Planctomycetota bacterium]